MNPLTDLQSLVEQYKDDFALTTIEAQLLVSCAQHSMELKGDAQRDYARQCVEYYKRKRPDDFFNTPKGREIFNIIADAYSSF